ncbi:hypothetical protein BJY04DRAFT_181010 [Aspergillus karnatakaensis]|uniref:uncharacterized protein n=1 Tax=Aspergillus karnatakaensis TaxID=1810916 RepID=UPI003CCDDCAE
MRSQSARLLEQIVIHLSSQIESNETRNYGELDCYLHARAIVEMSADNVARPTELPEHPPHLVHTVRGITATVGLGALIVCCLRLVTRKFISHSFGLDDYLVIVALILVLLFAILSIVVTFYGVGYHMATIPEDTLDTMQYIVYISLCTYLFPALAVKTSLTVFIMRIFPTKTITRIGKGMIIFMVLMTISGEFPLIFQCKPVRAAYDKSDPNFSCYSADVLMQIQLYQAILMFLIDVVIIGLPMPTIWKLQMPIRRRLTIIALFALGLIACAAGLARIPLLGYQKDAVDFSSAGALPLILMNTEYCLGLITGSLPSLMVLFRLRKQQKSRSRSQEWSSGADRSGGYQLSDRSKWNRKGMAKMTGDGESVKSESEQRIFAAPKAGQEGI